MTQKLTALPVLLLLVAFFAVQPVQAANGDGLVLSYKPNTVSTGTDVVLQVQFVNDATDGSCLDELIVTPPATWGGQATLTKYDRLPSLPAWSNEADLTCNALQTDLQSVRIVPTHPICSGETVNLEISGLVAPSDYEVSEIKVLTSDQNGGPPSCIRAVADTMDVYVTHAINLKLEYFHITNFSPAGFQGRAWGAWARLDELHLDSDGGTLTVTMETGTTDTVIYGPTALAGGVETISMDYTGWDPLRNTADLNTGYLRDQAGARQYYITYSGSTLELLGSEDEILDDADLTSSGLTGAVGTIITAGGSEQRKVLVQLTDKNGYDINEVIPLEVSTDLGSITAPTPYMTDTDGNAYFTLNPGCQYGIANVRIYTDPIANVWEITELVGIDSGAPVSFAVVEGDGAEVGAGESGLIVVEAYDSCGNVVSNTHQQLVAFDYLSGCNGHLAQVAGEASSETHVQEFTDMGVADVYVNTECELCTHEIGVIASGLGSDTVEMTGVPGGPAKMVVTASADEITADACVDATIEVTDMCGNRVEEILSHEGLIEEWESIVRVTIEEPLQTDQPWPEYGYTHIASSDFREAYNAGSYVQGKLNLGVGHLTICGCMGLGTFEIVAVSDTIEDGSDMVSVINAEPECIETTMTDQLLQCEKHTDVDVAIKDMCGNYWRNQDCLGGPAMYCVDLGLSGTCGTGASLSTNTVCVNVGLGGPGYLEVPVTLSRDTEECCEVELSAANGEDCCEDFPTLPQCGDDSLLFHGAPAYMTTEFFKTRTDPYTQYLQIHELLEGSETVSEQVLDLFTVYDECGHIVKDFDGWVDVEVKGEDITSIYQVDHPIVAEGYCEGDEGCGEYTSMEDCEDNGCTWYELEECAERAVVKKLVIHNEREQYDKYGYWPAWIPLEKEDIVVDKLAFQVDTLEDVTGLRLFVFLENEVTPGFQFGEDIAVGKAPIINGGATVIELEDSPTPYWDDQRQGGVVIRAEDSRDFYIAIVDTQSTVIPCGEYVVNFLYYQDYNSPDVTGSGSGHPDQNSDGIIDAPYGGSSRDGCVGSDNFNWIGPGTQAPHPVCPYSGPALGGRKDSRNDDYGHTTPSYGFGDRVLYSLQFSNGQAWMTFRDLVAEDVEVHVSGIAMNTCPETGHCLYEEFSDIRPNPEEITFEPQPATQVKLLNHDVDESKYAACDEWDMEENGVHFNIQVTDGFDNPVEKSDIEVELDYCLKWPFGTEDIRSAVQMYCMADPEHRAEEELCKESFVNNEYCFTRSDMKKILMAEADYFGDALFGDFFGQEIADWIDWYFQNAQVKFFDKSGIPLPVDANGKQYVVTDVNGQAEVYATSATAGFFKIKAVPTALDADFAFVSFSAGIPEKLDIAALPAFGVPADGEEEAMLLVRALDHCGNMVSESFSGLITVTAVGDRHGTEQVVISQDFDGKNNYDNSVTGYLGSSMFGLTKLRVMDDIPETATITASASGLTSDTTQVVFQGAPVKLAIVGITPSDRLPADGQTGAWVTIQVQDRNGNRVTGYLGEGFQGDPGDPWGFTDYTFENICVKLDDVEAGFPAWYVGMTDARFGWLGFMSMPGFDGPVYCGNLMFGEGQIYVTYGNFHSTHGGTVKATVFDMMPFQGQEYNENGLPLSVHATELAPASGTIDFVDPATQWNLLVDNPVALADGQSVVRIQVQVENPYMDVRQAVKGNVYIGGTAQSGAVLSWMGQTDELNPTSARFITDPLTGATYLELTSTEPGVAEVTVTGGDAFTCLGIDDVTLSACMAWCGNLPLGGDCLAVCLSGDLGIYNGVSGEEYIPKFFCDYNSWEDLTPKTITVEFIEVADNELYLESGWNFISTPYALTTPAVVDLFAPIMGSVDAFWGWDASAQAWVGYSPASSVQPLNGYWVKMNSPAVLTLDYATSGMPSIPTKPVYAGWDTVGLTVTSPWNAKEALNSIDKSYSNIIGWNAVSQAYDFPVANTGTGIHSTTNSKMQPKKGYWIWVTGSDTVAGLTAM
ncbi:MAG: hypothetical protein JW716_01105 [Candidatus Aenigmarchaeota archaeon]|nr:hypothetical protein [Candidatus Aenigmarchaeota archaeon]